MVLTLHNLAKTYKILPSEALSSGTTFDLYVLDTYHRYVNYEEQKALGNAPPARKTHYTQEELQAMIDRVRGAKNESKES